MSQKRATTRSARNNTKHDPFELKSVVPKTTNQQLVFENFDDNSVISMRGLPGTGKTFIGMYLALKEILSKSTPYRKLIIVRSDVSVRPTGFLPGSIEEKTSVHEAPYEKHASKLIGRDGAYTELKKRGIVDFMSTAHIRGIEFENTIVLVDEYQNCSMQELHSIITRFGENCKYVMCGDNGQDDLTSKRYQEESGYARMNTILDKIDECYSVDFGVEDIIRSGFLKKYILATMS